VAIHWPLITRTDKPVRVPRGTMDCRVVHSVLLAMTKTTHHTTLLSSRGLKARGDPLALITRTDKPVRVPRDTMDCRVAHTVFLAMTMSVLSSRGLKARGDLLRTSKRRDKPVHISRGTMDCRVVHSVLLAMTKRVVIARAESPWRSTGPHYPNRQPVRVRRDTMDCRVGHLCSLLARTM